MERGTGDRAAIGKIIARAWTDEGYKARLVSDPRSVFEEAGLDLPDGLDIRVVEDTPGVHNFVLPCAPAEGELSEEALEQVAAGVAAEIVIIPPPPF
ncbi:MAG: NHLP leader peptide family RiPP precursor [Solirubrobacterales bacterium]